MRPLTLTLAFSLSCYSFVFSRACLSLLRGKAAGWQWRGQKRTHAELGTPAGKAPRPLLSFHPSRRQRRESPRGSSHPRGFSPVASDFASGAQPPGAAFLQAGAGRGPWLFCEHKGQESVTSGRAPSPGPLTRTPAPGPRLSLQHGAAGWARAGGRRDTLLVIPAVGDATPGNADRGRPRGLRRVRRLLESAGHPQHSIRRFLLSSRRRGGVRLGERGVRPGGRPRGGDPPARRLHQRRGAAAGASAARAEFRGGTRD